MLHSAYTYTELKESPHHAYRYERPGADKHPRGCDTEEEEAARTSGLPSLEKAEALMQGACRWRDQHACA